jgi:hypothetical protein
MNLVPVCPDDLEAIADALEDTRDDLDDALSDLHLMVLIDLEKWGSPNSVEPPTYFDEPADLTPVQRTCINHGIRRFDSFDNGGNRYHEARYYIPERTIELASTISPRRKVELILHELGHHHAITLRGLPYHGYPWQQVRHEIIAESVAYLVLYLLGRGHGHARKYLRLWVDTNDLGEAQQRLNADREVIKEIARLIADDVRKEQANA